MLAADSYNAVGLSLIDNSSIGAIPSTLI